MTYFALNPKIAITDDKKTFFSIITYESKARFLTFVPGDLKCM